MNELDLAYLAGLTDGEAYIGITKTAMRNAAYRASPRYKARFAIRMVDEPAIRTFCDSFRGVYGTTQYPNRRLMHYFHASDFMLDEMLPQLLPFLRLKKRQAECVLELRQSQLLPKRERMKREGFKIMTNQYGTEIKSPIMRLSDEYLADCERLYLLCQSLNYGANGQR